MESFIRGMPKAELHVHIEGALEPEMMLELARRNGVRIRFDSVAGIRAAHRFADLQSFLDLYYEGVSVLLTKRDFYDLTYAYLRRATAAGVRHSEVFFDPQAHTARGVPFERVIDGIHTALADGRERLGISGGLILCFLRHLDEEAAMQTLEQALPARDRLLGVGLDSSEAGNPPAKFARVFARARQEGLRVVAHAGEEGPPEYVWQALDLLEAERIDHGVRSLEDPRLLERLARDRIPLTVCPLSNVCLRVFPSMERHNLKRLLDAGVRVTINSDDPAYFGGYIDDNYLAAQRALGLTRSELVEIAANGFRAAFLSEPQQAALLAELEDYAKNAVTASRAAGRRRRG